MTNMITPKGLLSRTWLVEHEACNKAVEWYDSLPRRGRTAARIWETCPVGNWLLWWHEQAGTPTEVLAPVSFRAADRAVRTHAADAMEAAGLVDQAAALRSLPEIIDIPTALDAARAAAEAAARATAERLRCADDCRELLGVPR